MINSRQHYIKTLMSLYTDMVHKNEQHEQSELKRKVKHNDDNKLNIKKEYFYAEVPPYSDTMLHSIITIINKLNNNEI